MGLTIYFCVFDENEEGIVVSQKTLKAQMGDLNTKLGLEIGLENFNWAETRILLCF